MVLGYNLRLALLSHIFIQSDWMLQICSEPLNSCTLRMEIRHPIYRSPVVVELAISPRVPAISSRHQSLDNLPEETSVAEVTVFNTATAFHISISKENLSTAWNSSFVFFWNQALKAPVFSTRKKQHFFHQPCWDTTLSFRGDVLFAIFSVLQYYVYNTYLVHWKLTFHIIISTCKLISTIFFTS